MLKARCMYYLGQFEKSLLVWTKADRLRRNNKEVLNDILIQIHLLLLHVREAMDLVEETIHISLK